ncbi:uncharacterized protein LOC124897995 [Capsicum annuum]|uniref:uncharacterized protein LOC124897995 n=1 Tax=Capsicum annuum TaxID=4072 RepID=UPI001FB18133|nr:uncharacterized protein LOC124897995 [Capsicum annuum]
MLKELSLNIILLEVLEQMTGYARFMKHLVTNKKGPIIEDVDGLHHCSAVTTKSLSQKKGDPRAFTIPCTIGSSRFARALYFLEANINLRSLAEFKKLGLNPPEPTTMRLLKAGRMVKKPMGILFDVIVRFYNFIFLADFVILDYEVDTDMPIILRRLFMAKGRVTVDMGN